MSWIQRRRTRIKWKKKITTVNMRNLSPPTHPSHATSSLCNGRNYLSDSGEQTVLREEEETLMMMTMRTAREEEIQKGNLAFAGEGGRGRKRKKNKRDEEKRVLWQGSFSGSGWWQEEEEEDEKEEKKEEEEEGGISVCSTLSVWQSSLTMAADYP